MNSPSDVARALLRKATDDRYVAQSLARDANAPAWILGFHAEQAVEKALKAVLAHRSVAFPRTHNLAVLLELLTRSGLALPPDADDLARLIPFGVMARYEDALGEADIPIDSTWAVDAAMRTVDWAWRVVSPDNTTRPNGQ